MFFTETRQMCTVNLTKALDVRVSMEGISVEAGERSTISYHTYIKTKVTAQITVQNMRREAIKIVLKGDLTGKLLEGSGTIFDSNIRLSFRKNLFRV
jgi:hypothetical protein